MNGCQPDGEETGIRSLAWWSSGKDAMLPMQGPGFDPSSGNQIPQTATKIRYHELQLRPSAAK